MAVHFLQTTNPPPDKCREYFQVINTNLQKIEDGLERLRILREGSR
jgi:hypothetical protein